MRLFEDILHGAEKEAANPLNRKTLLDAAVAHGILLAAALACSSCTSSPQETIVPIDMTIVLPPPPEEEVQQEPEIVKKVEEPPPQLDDKLDAVEKKVEKPKPPEEKKEEKKKEEPPPKPKKVKKPVVVDKSVVVKGEKPKPPPKVPTSTIKTNEKPLSEADILKALGGGARPGATNSLPKNEGERCFGVIKRTIDREWSRESFTWYAGLRSGIVEIQLGKDGTLRGWRLAGTTGSAEVDNSIRRAMTRIERFHGLTATFISTYPVISIELKPVGR